MRPKKSIRCGLKWTPFLLLLFPLLGFFPGCGGSDLKFPTEYQAVFLDNGQVFFGRLDEAGSSYLTLRDIYYVQRHVDQEKKETKNILIKRGSEWHAPDFMRINTRHVVLIEPVGPDSRLAKLIREAKSPPAARPVPREEEKKLPAPPPKDGKKPSTGR